MSRIIKLLGSETNLSTATAFNNAQLVRVYNNTAGDILVTVKQDATTTGTVTVKAGSIEFIRKQSSETIQAASAVKAVAIAYGD
jgi:hypothetical protein